jgi:hypothetical protein
VLTAAQKTCNLDNQDGSRPLSLNFHCRGIIRYYLRLITIS